jgi:hypothetical protein
MLAGLFWGRNVKCEMPKILFAGGLTTEAY